jgi:stage II sporulation protein D
MRWRRGVLVAAVLALVGALPWAPPTRRAGAAGAVPDTFVFPGSGFGHGVGMSQYGAYGQALEGRSATEILTHYYTGTTVAAVDDAVDLRVNLVHAAPAGTLYVRGEPVGGSGGSTTISAGGTTVTGAPNEAFVFGLDGTSVTVSRAGGAQVASGPSATVTFTGLLNVAGPGDTFESSGHRYRYGRLEVLVVGGALEAVLVLKLHGEYLRGIAEVPSSWPTAALEAQVIAARTYALRKWRLGERPECRCHVYDTVYDQVYAGWVKEAEPTYGARWVAAVEATSPSPTTGLAVLYGGDPISANYFSSSGGRTENNEDAFGGSPLPYLRSVDDHWSLASYNPRAAWRFTKSQADVAAAFGLSDVASLDLSRRTAGGAVKTAVARSSSGATASLAGTTLRSRLGLPGAWIRRPVVRVAGPDRYATSVATGRLAAPDDGGTVVLASGDTAHLVDGLVAGPLARHLSAPLLLTAPDALPDAVAAEIDRRRPTAAVLVGGNAAIGPAVADALAARGITVRRLAGDDRWATAAAVAGEVGAADGQVVVASGDPGHLVDALAVAGPAAATGRPILLSSRDTLPDPTAAALERLGVTSTVVVGGPAAIGDGVLARLPAPRRLAGADRFRTAVAIADDFSGPVGVAVVVVASGDDAHLVDALAGGALGRVTLLTAVSPLTTVTRDWLRARPDAGSVQVLGGPAAVADATFSAIVTAVGG